MASYMVGVALLAIFVAVYTQEKKTGLPVMVS